MHTLTYRKYLLYLHYLELQGEITISSKATQLTPQQQATQVANMWKTRVGLTNKNG